MQIKPVPTKSVQSLYLFIVSDFENQFTVAVPIFHRITSLRHKINNYQFKQSKEKSNKL